MILFPSELHSVLLLVSLLWWTTDSVTSLVTSVDSDMILNGLSCKVNSQELGPTVLQILWQLYRQALPRLEWY